MKKTIYKEQAGEGNLFRPLTFKEYMLNHGADFIDEKGSANPFSGVKSSMVFHFKNTTVKYHESHGNDSPLHASVTLFGNETNISEVERIILEVAKDHQSAKIRRS